MTKYREEGNTGAADIEKAGSGAESRIDEIQTSREAALKIIKEMEWANRSLEVEVKRRKRVESVLKKNYLELKRAVEAEATANMAKSEFLATMSHEIRTPLNSIMGFLTLLKRTELSPDQREYADIVEGASETLLLLINDILDISKIEAGRLELEHVPFSLYELMRGICRTMAIRAHVKGLELNWNIKKGTPLSLRGDATRLLQVLLNLLTNAIKFTRKGEIFLEAELTRLSDQHLILGFSVIDTGVGVPESDRKRIFDSFWQVVGSGAREFSGTGLGLYISKKIVEMMGGEIGVKPDRSGGSLFHFTVKLENGRETPEEEREFFRERALVVDSCLRTRCLLREELETHGAGVVESATAGEALQALAESRREALPFKVILLESKMKGVWEMAKSIEAGDVESIVVLLTASELAWQHGQMKEAGITRCLVKPVPPDTLWEVLLSTGSGREKARNKRGEKAGVCASIEPPARILLVEDSLDNQRIVRAFLKYCNYHLHVVSNGKEAVEAVCEKDFDLILMDINMPVMDGFQAARAIKKIKNSVPVVALTALVFRDDRERCKAAGMDDYISKPLEIKEFLRKVKEVIESHA